MAQASASLAVLAMLSCGLVMGVSSAEPADPYDALYDAIMVREVAPIFEASGTVGRDEFAPLLWKDSRYLIEGESALRFRRALADFSALSEAEIDAYPSIKRAILQRHLWAVFDWAASVEAAELVREETAHLIRRLSLSRQEIDRLPDTLAATSSSGKYPPRANPADPFQPFFPERLADPAGPWICLTKSPRHLTARVHTEYERWRSCFQVYLALPGGRSAALEYLKELSEFRDPWTMVNPGDLLQRRTRPSGGIHDVGIYVNPETPQFPAGTRVAMVEQVLLIRDNGDIVPSPLVSSVQVREYLRVDSSLAPNQPEQAVAEFHANPRDLVKGMHALRALAAGERHVRTFAVASDPFEHPGAHTSGTGARLRGCMGCHSAWGIHSVNSRAQMFETITLMPPRLTETDPESIIRFTIEAKRNDYTWGLLQGLVPTQ